jgi:hypothetical protein
MPVVPVERLQSVESAGAPNLTVRDSSSPADFGAGIGSALGDLANGLGQAGNAALNIQAQKNEENRTSSTLDAYSQYQTKTNETLYQGDGALLGKVGKDAIGVGKSYADLAGGIYRDIDATISDPKAKQAFRKMAVQRDQSVSEALMRHEFDQSKAYKSDSLKAALASSVDSATSGFTDPKIVDNAIATGTRAIHAQNAGEPDEFVNQQVREFTSQVHSGIVSRMATSDINAAYKYYQDHGDEITGPEHIQLDRMFAPKRTAEAENSFVNTATGVSKAASDLTDAGGRLISAIGTGESDGNPNAEHPVRISGGKQVQASGQHGVLISTARELSPRVDGGALAGKSDAEIKEALKNPGLSAAYSARMMDDQLKRYNGDIEAALIAYNAGPANADKWIKAGRSDDALPRPGETRKYVDKVMGRYADLSGGGITAGPDPTPYSQIAIGKDLPAAGQRLTPDNWNLKFYKPKDMMAPTAGGQFVDARAATMADALGKRFFDATGIRVPINDDYDPANPGPTAGKRRGTADVADNPHVSKSQHLLGRAFDFQVQKLTPEQKSTFLQMAREVGFSGVGFYEGKSGHLHLDTGRARSWGAVPSWAQTGMRMTVPTGGEGDQATMPGASAPLPSGLNTRTGPYSEDKRVATKRVAIESLPASASTNALLFSPTYGMTGAVGATTVPTVPPVMPTTVKTNDFDLDGSLAAAAAQFGEDSPSYRNIERRLRAYQSKVDRDNTADAKELSKALWTHIVGGGDLDNADPKLLAQAMTDAPESVGKMQDFIDKRTSKQKTTTNWETYSTLQNTRARDPDAWRETNLYDYRNQLGDEEFKSLSQAQVADIQAGDAAAHKEGFLTTKALIDNAVAGFGWKESAPADAQRIGLLQGRMAAWESEYRGQNKKEPDLAAKEARLAYLTKPVPGGMFGSDKYVFEVGSAQENIDKRANNIDTSNVDGFNAVSNYKDIPVDDLTHLIKTFRSDNGGATPTPEDAVRYYNDAYRASVGGVVEPSENDKAEFLSGLRRAFPSKNITDQMLQKYYADWVVRYLPVSADQTTANYNSQAKVISAPVPAAPQRGVSTAPPSFRADGVPISP